MDKPDALRLADEMDQYLYSVPAHPLCTDAAVELRRLHAQRDALLEALSNLVDHIDFISTDPYYRDETRKLVGSARAAIKAAEQTP